MRKYKLTFEETNIIERFWMKHCLYTNQFRLVRRTKNLFGKIYYIIETDINVNKVLNK